MMVELEGAPGQDMFWMQKDGMCSCGNKDCKGDCGHKGGHKGMKMMKMGCGHTDPSQCTEKCKEKCKHVEIIGDGGKCHMEIMDDKGGRKRIHIKAMEDAECKGKEGKIIIKTEDGTKTIDISDMDIDLDLEDLNLDDLDLDEFHKMHMYHLQDAGDLEEEIEELQQEIEELKKELKKLKKS
jgi:hypothetical protein